MADPPQRQVLHHRRRRLGLAVAKNFKQRASRSTASNARPDLGGLWNIATNSGIVYETTHLVSSI